MCQSELSRSVRRASRYFLAGVLVTAIAAISVLGVQQSIDEFGPSWRAATGHGVAGAFTPERVDAAGRGGRRQEWRGTFVSTDQRIIRRDVVLDTPPDRMRIGLTVPARDTGARRVVYGEGTPIAPVKSLAVLVLMAFGCGLAAWWLVGRLRRSGGRGAAARRQQGSSNDQRQATRDSKALRESTVAGLSRPAREAAGKPTQTTEPLPVRRLRASTDGPCPTVVHVDDHEVVRLKIVGLNSIAHLLPKARGRCGVYELTFADGQRYVGQAVDVVTRFCAHRRTWSDMVEIAFERVSRAQLDKVERDQIRRREAAGVQLRNVVHTTGRLGASELDVLLPSAEQRRWLADHQPGIVRLGDRPVDSVLQHRSRHRFNRLQADPRFTDELARLVGAYLRVAMPVPELTELSYWTVSALPSTSAATYPRLLTVSVHALETLFVYHERHTPQELQIRLNIDGATARSHLRTRIGLALMRPVEAHYRIRPGVLGLHFTSMRSAYDALTRPGIIKAARQLNLDLMRKGPALNWKTHCPDLVEHVLSV
ncbi:GIY-YIG nuclease family protein [Micromonospora sp. NRRL B-16802]|nr:GIY-YIG nuclease family protein [Micromonospora sp. NRRL B-16802]